MKNRLPLLACIAITASTAFGSDFGVSVSAVPKYLDGDTTFTTSASPWFSALLGESGELYLSAVTDVAYESEEWDARLDLGRFQATVRPRTGVRVDAGRFAYSDASGFVARGLFDGARVAYSLTGANFLIGGFYTGLLNKERAEIVMSDADAIDAVDDDLFFAPKRALVTAAAEIPSFFGRYAASAEALGQFDLRDGDEAVHSQYLCFRVSGPLTRLFSITASMASGFVEKASVNIAASLALRSELSFYPDGGPSDRAYLGITWASGSSGSLGAFLPVKGLNAGSVFEASQTGVASFKGGYFARLMDTLSVDLSASLFLRQGDGVVDAELDIQNDDAYLGTELYGEAVFAPTSEFSFIGGTGLFFPSSAAFDSDAAVRPLFTASFIVSF